MARKLSKERPHGVCRNDVEAVIDFAVSELFERDSQIQSVGVGRYRDQFGVSAVKSLDRIRPLSLVKRPSEIKGVPVLVRTVRNVQPLLDMPVARMGRVPVSSRYPQRAQMPTLYCGLQVQNYDYDARSRRIKDKIITVGTIGAFVRMDGDRIGLLSNNHVLAGCNNGKKSKDRSLHAGSLVPEDSRLVATLWDFVDLKPSNGSGPPNYVDAAVSHVFHNQCGRRLNLMIGGCP
jgi:hypothetical protein